MIIDMTNNSIVFWPDDYIYAEIFLSIIFSVVTSPFSLSKILRQTDLENWEF